VNVGHGNVAVARDRGIAGGQAGAGRDAAGRDLYHADRDLHVHNGPSVAEIVAAITPQILGAVLEREKMHEHMGELVTRMERAVKAMEHAVTEMNLSKKDRAERITGGIRVAEEMAEVGVLPIYAATALTAFVSAAETFGILDERLVTREIAASASKRCHDLVKDTDEHEDIASANPSAPQPDVAPRERKTEAYYRGMERPFETLGLESLGKREREQHLRRRMRDVPAFERSLIQEMSRNKAGTALDAATKSVRMEQRAGKANARRRIARRRQAAYGAPRASSGSSEGSGSDSSSSDSSGSDTDGDD
jgi:hypothetical protein